MAPRSSCIATTSKGCGCTVAWPPRFERWPWSCWPFVVIWISIQLFGGRWDSRQTLVALTVAVVAAAAIYLRAELRLRSYRLDLTSDAVIFEYGRKRSYVPREHIQLFDTESSILLRIFRLRRCNLHTGGGMVVVSPVPARVASAIERLIYEQPAMMRADRTDANS